jgi:hypothetical protein
VFAILLEPGIEARIEDAVCASMVDMEKNVFGYVIFAAYSVDVGHLLDLRLARIKFLC